MFEWFVPIMFNLALSMVLDIFKFSTFKLFFESCYNYLCSNGHLEDCLQLWYNRPHISDVCERFYSIHWSALIFISLYKVEAQFNSENYVLRQNESFSLNHLIVKRLFIHNLIVLSLLCSLEYYLNIRLMQKN